MSVAINPKNGKQIRIMTLDTPAWRDQKTLVWIDEGTVAAAASASPTLSRWEVGATSIAVWGALTSKGIHTDIVICLDESYDVVREWFEQGHWRSVTIVVVPLIFFKECGAETLTRWGVKNMICLDEIHEVYPYVGGAWNGGLEDAKVIVGMALRFPRIMGCRSGGRGVQAERLTAAGEYGVTLREGVESVPPLWLVTQFYHPSNSRRRREIEACLKANVACDLIDRIVLLDETACCGGLGAAAKVQEIVTGRRIDYAAVLRWIRDEAPEDAIVVFANSDIFFEDESLRLLWSVNLETPARFFALLRWDVGGTDAESIRAAKLFGPRADSQDTWVVSAAAVKTAFAGVTDWSAFSIPFGTAGCDNAITVEMLRKKFQIANPAINLRTYHYHTSAVRTYDPRDIVDRPMYAHVQPSGLHDLCPVTKIPEKPVVFKPAALKRPIRGLLTTAQKLTFCKMIERSSRGAVQLDPEGENLWVPPAVPLYNFKNAFQSREGLAYKYGAILVGDGATAAEVWSKAKLSTMAACLYSKKSIAVPLSDEVAKSAGKYVSQYLAKVLLMRGLFPEIGPTAEFWCEEGLSDVLRLFRWKAAEDADGSRGVPVMSRKTTYQAWSESLAAWLPRDGSTLCSSEEVAALRSAAMAWDETIDEDGPKKLVIAADDKWMSDEVAEKVEAGLSGAAGALQVKFIWPGRTNLEAMAAALRGAWGLLFTTEKGMADWLWLLPRGARVWEVQSEMEPSIQGLHMAAAAGLDHHLCIVSKGAPTFLEVTALVEKLVESIRACTQATPKPGIEILQSNADSPLSSASKPLIRMPAGHKGFYAHAGDSFREMVRLWAERGFVDIIEDPEVHQIWVGRVGDTLLYDRPKLDWLWKAPLEERRGWRLALFGNPAVTEDVRALGRSSPWTFWPRRPRLVEALVAQGAGLAGFKERASDLVFYGRSENGVQLANRTKEDWSRVCSEFVHVKGEGAYPYTHEEYLIRLSGAKYGLCLAGYGDKCHREIECMAMGCVPVVAPEVDMDSYANPPKEGVHYFRVGDASEAAQVVEKTTEAQWEVMSSACRVWWAANASVAGSWNVTKKLLAAAGKA